MILSPAREKLPKIWAKVTPSKRAPIYVCSFYRPPDLSIDPILQLGLSLNTLTRRFTELPNIIVMGDFNLPGINWLDGSGQVISNPSYGVELNNIFLDQINDIGLNKFVNTPTRNNNILDLVLSTSSTILDLTTAPGMSDQTHPPIHTNRAFSPDQLRIGTTYHLPSLRATILTLFQRNCKHCIELNNCNLCNYVAKFIL